MDRPTRLSIDRRHSLAGRKNLEWFFANRKWVRTAKPQILECSWAIRPLPDKEAATRFLLLAPSKSYKRAHDRNKIKRWLRAGIAEVPDFASLESELATDSKQLLIMLRISKPLVEVKWQVILDDLHLIAHHLAKRIAKEPLQ